MRTKKVYIFASACLVLLVVFTIKACQARRPRLSDGFPLKQIWETRLKDKIEHLSISDDGFVFVRTKRTLTCLSADTGEVQWTFGISKQIISSPAVIHDRGVYLADGKMIWALDPKNGNPFWRKPLEDSAAWVTDVDDKSLLVNMPSDEARAYTTADGELLWSTFVSSRGPMNAYLDEDIAYIIDLSIKALDTQTGKTLWSKESGIVSRNAYDNEGVLFYEYWENSDSSQKSIRAFDVHSQKRLWETKVSDENINRIVTHENNVIVLGSDKVHVMRSNDGVVVWEVGFFEPRLAAVVGEDIYILEGFNRKIRAFQLATGKYLGALQTVPVIFEVKEERMIANQGTLIYADNDTLYGFMNESH